MTCYDDDVEVAERQERRFFDEFPKCLTDQYGVGVVDTEGMWRKTLELLTDVFGTAGRQEIGNWPNSCAYYSVDVIYDATGLETSGSMGFVPQPKLLEINFMGDWHGVETALHHDQARFYAWIRDLLDVLVFTDRVSVEELDQNPRLTRLRIL